MLRQLTIKLQDPRLWLFAGAGCFVASFLMGYHQAQQAADQLIALHSAPAQAVTIQDRSALRENRTSPDVRILAETDIDAPVVAAMPREDGGSQIAVLYPLYPVSRPGREAISRVEGRPLRPVQRPRRPLTRRPDALGIAVFYGETADAAIATADASFASSLGGGRFGRVVELNGLPMEPGQLEFVAQGAMAAMGGVLAKDFLTVKPFKKSRMEAVTPPPLPPLYTVLRGLALLFGAAAIVLSLYPQLLSRRPRRKSTTIEQRPNVSVHRSFAPIATQDEIAEAEVEARKARTRAYVAHPVLRIIDGFIEESKSLVRSRIRSRRSPRAD